MDIKQELEMIGVGFNFLKLAIKADDPKEQLLLRAADEHKKLMDVLKYLDVKKGSDDDIQ